MILNILLSWRLYLDAVDREVARRRGHATLLRPPLLWGRPASVDHFVDSVVLIMLLTCAADLC
jgi:hypothetical protein